MAGSCGSCTACCSILAIRELDKPKQKHCPNCNVGVGCRIYDNRPESCQAFRCIWLQTQDSSTPMPMHLRPDKSKVVLHLNPDGKSVGAKVHIKYPLAWQEGDMAKLLLVMSQTVLILIDNGRSYWVLDKQSAREVRVSEADEDGNEHVLGYVDAEPKGSRSNILET